MAFTHISGKNQPQMKTFTKIEMAFLLFTLLETYKKQIPLSTHVNITTNLPNPIIAYLPCFK